MEPSGASDGGSGLDPGETSLGGASGGLAGIDLRVDRAGEVPLGTQLAWKLRELVAERLAPGDRLPSLRAVAAAAGVNVNTVRAVYARLEADRLVRSEQGRGTFVADRAAPRQAGDEAAIRRQLRSQIARLEAALVRHPPPPLAEPQGGAPSLLSTEDLEAVRDGLLERLHELDAQRAELVLRLEQLGAEESPAAQMTERPAPPSRRRSSPSLAGARIRWVGA
jgi:DNA-binding transcriptional regulator YhcF (GntR family)